MKAINILNMRHVLHRMEEPQTADVLSFFGLQWEWSPPRKGESYEAWLKRLDDAFLQSVQDEITKAGLTDDIAVTAHKIRGYMSHYMTNHPLRKILVELVIAEIITRPIQISMSKEEFERTYIGTWLPEKKQHDCPMDAVTAVFHEAAFYSRENFKNKELD